MITLITGLPGNGKTLYALWLVQQLAKKEGRQVWYHGIKGLKLDWNVIPTKLEKINGREEEVPQWWLCPAKSIIVIDEAQNAGFGVRPRGQCPEWGQKLETHRHLGVDIYFITQDPSLIDAHDRKLIELHFHVMRSFGMQRAVVHEFRPVRENVLKSRKGSIEHRWGYPKEVFGWYTSAEAHTHKRRIPAKVWIFLALPFLVGGISWFAWAKYLDPHRARPGQAVAAPGAAGVPAYLGQPAAAAKLTRAEYVDQHAPRVEGLAYTAPVYDEVTKPVVAPYPAAAVLMGSKGCRAYSQQGTRLDMPDAMCRQIVERGFFIAWQQPQAQPAPPAAPIKADTPAVAPAGPAVAVIGGRGRIDMAPGPSPRYDGFIEQSAPTSRPSRQAPG